MRYLTEPNIENVLQVTAFVICKKLVINMVKN